ncbi:uncharacterized protein LOC101863715 [Aplysia californica]|uniref:Uncharacterized protein LOC101863715 n=1 Tax=Aplysia californica TaxID=6500 RepID=A0ABM0KAF6_APLCA|nr:uncharacterized protein LOC101863715 [Aplysia californica]
MAEKSDTTSQSQSGSSGFRWTRQLLWATWAEFARANQGPCCEMDIYLKADDNLNFKRCQKNPGHSSFIPLHELKPEHLPEKARRPDVLRYIKHVACRTVRLVVGYTSKHRSADMSYPSLQGTNAPRVGSGFVRELGMNLKGRAATEIPHADFFELEEDEFYVDTAAHVVFNEEEAKHTTVDLFFDNDSDSSTVIQAKGVKMDSVSEDFDQVIFIARLNKKDLDTAYEKLMEVSPSPIPFIPNFAFCVSHPHGVAKRVSFGEPEDIKSHDVDSEELRQNRWKYICYLKARHGIEEGKTYFVILYSLALTRVSKKMSSAVYLENSRFPIKRLVDKGLLICPSDDEIRIISKCIKVNDNTLDKIRQDREYVCGQDGMESTSSQPPEGSTSDKSSFDFRVFELMLKALRKEHSQTWLQNLFRESTGNSQSFEQLFPEDDDHPTGTVSYRVPTCPGSSGANVHSMIVKDGDELTFSSPHSQGPKGKPGIGKNGYAFCDTLS